MIMIMMIITMLPVNIMNANVKSQEKEEEFGEDRLGRLRTCLWDLLEYPETSKVFYNRVNDNRVGCLLIMLLLFCFCSVLGCFLPFFCSSI